MNRYTPDGSAIIDATGKEWPVETPHLVPLPEGITDFAHGNAQYPAILFSADGKWIGYKGIGSRFWLARRPLPEVPRVKTQEELDEEEFQAYWGRTPLYGAKEGERNAFMAAIAYARKGEK